MANPTTNYGFIMPTSTDLVTDLPADFDVFGQAVDTQMLTNANAAIAKTIVDAKGDLIGASAADTPARLAVGTNGQVLTADSTAATGLAWATATSGGMTLLTTLTLTGATVSYTSISQSYKDLLLVTRNFRPASNGQNMLIRLNQDSTANRHATRDTGVEANNVAFNVTSIQILNNANSGVAGQAFGIATINDYTNTATWKYVNSFAVTNDATTSTNATYSTKQGAYNQTSAITSFDLITSSGNFTSGSVLVYGVK